MRVVVPVDPGAKSARSLRAASTASTCVAVAALALTAGCFNGGGDDSDNGFADPGDVSFDWTVAESTDPAECTSEGSPQITIAIYDQGGASVDGPITVTWAQGETTTALPAGRYSATAFLLGGDGKARTSIVDIDPFDVQANGAYTIPLDFPASSFF